VDSAVAIAPSPDAVSTLAEVTDVADSVTRLNRCFSRMRSQFLAAANNSVEWAAHILINTLAVEGPMRSSALAETIQSDPSTVSRQVQQLVLDGLVERRADPQDGRASVLAVTPRGMDVYRDHRAHRNHKYHAMLADWTPAELEAFSAQLRRFTAALETTWPQLPPATTFPTVKDDA
jgi:DNA-binding MarR family transcriptional regulator